MIVGMKPLQRRLRAVSETREIMHQIQLETIAGAKARVPRKTGFLARSIVPGGVSDSGTAIHVNAPYAAAVEFGSKPHVIVPKQARVLAWPAAEGDRRLSGRARKGTKSGSMIFARKVNHPGSRAQPFIIPAALEAVRKKLGRIIVKAWNEAG